MEYSLEFGTIITALVAILVAAFEYRQLKEKRKSELFSEFNKRYLSDEKNVQPVIRYISRLYPDAPVPKGYQIELFLRYFEELDVYLKKKVLDEETTYHLFAYYCLEIFKPEFISLLEGINFQEEEWHLLTDFIARMKNVEHKNRYNGSNKM